jgi:hypothetical protein
MVVVDAVINDYPAAEAIRSVLPLVHEMIVSTYIAYDQMADQFQYIGDSQKCM